MNARELNQVPIQEYLLRLGHTPTIKNYKHLLYSAPYREDRHPSFCVNLKNNLWRDYATNEGGTLTDLVMKLIGTRDLRAVIKEASEVLNVSLPKEYEKIRYDSASIAPTGKDIVERDLRSNALIHYITKERGIDYDIAREYCREVVNEKGYYSLSFKNDAGGYALRSPGYKGRPEGFKGNFGRTDITTFSKGGEMVLLFEGFMDYLSYLTFTPKSKRNDVKQISAVVLNSVTNIEKAIPFLKRFNRVGAFLDNDGGGLKAMLTVKKAGLPIKNYMQDRFSDYNDLNDVLIAKKKEEQQKNKVESKEEKNIDEDQPTKRSRGRGL